MTRLQTVCNIPYRRLSEMASSQVHEECDIIFAGGNRPTHGYSGPPNVSPRFAPTSIGLD
ncbi:hypothetical protein C8Q74DRAFT_1447389 [Fomes fomentarius]|nr:hypothetical protein C8Q74DRAFT_1447389 [Fomes fomentarius]